MLGHRYAKEIITLQVKPAGEATAMVSPMVKALNLVSSPLRWLG